MYNGDVISMPDKWEYPWYAAWDLAFHVLALTLVDPDFGKQQLKLMLRERYMHPNGQIPAYEWNFGDVNPPVHAWATIFTYRLEKGQTGEGDKEWLKSSFQKLLLNFTWWVNRKDRTGRNVFEGGFLGLDNIGVFDRSSPLPTGGYLEQADGTAWMALFCQNMLQIAAELAMTDPDYADMALKFVEHFMWIASSMTHLGGETGMWDEEDGFFYDVLRLPDGRAERLKVRSMVGLLPLCAATVFDGEVVGQVPGTRRAAPVVPRKPARAVRRDPRPAEARRRRPQARVDPRRDQAPPGAGEDARRERVPQRVRHPLAVALPREAPVRDARGRAGVPGGLPAGRVRHRHVRRQLELARADLDAGERASSSGRCCSTTAYYGNDFTVECPTGSGRQMNLYQVAEEISRRLANIFLRDKDGRRPVYGGTEKFQTDPHWRDLVLFYEYFHGDNGAGLGASHQTGWTGIVARTMHLFATMKPEQVLEGGKKAYFRQTQPPPVERPPAAAAPLTR